MMASLVLGENAFMLEFNVGIIETERENKVFYIYYNWYVITYYIIFE